MTGAVKIATTFAERRRRSFPIWRDGTAETLLRGAVTANGRGGWLEGARPSKEDS